MFSGSRADSPTGPSPGPVSGPSLVTPVQSRLRTPVPETHQFHLVLCLRFGTEVVGCVLDRVNFFWSVFLRSPPQRVRTRRETEADGDRPIHTRRGTQRDSESTVDILFYYYTWKLRKERSGGSRLVCVTRQLRWRSYVSLDRRRQVEVS